MALLVVKYPIVPCMLSPPRSRLLWIELLSEQKPPLSSTQLSPQHGPDMLNFGTIKPK